MAENNQNMPEPALKYMRIPEESRDVFVLATRRHGVLCCWRVSYFGTYVSFASPERGFDLIYTKLVNKQPANHMYASNGIWAFDVNGWSLEKGLLKVNETFAKDRYPNWNYERIVIKKACRSI